jgi:hypothetical protein
LGCSLILVERARESKREVEMEKRDSICKRRAQILRQITGTNFEATDSKEEQAVRYGFLEVVQH